MADGLLNKASIILTPTGYKAGTLYNVAPVVEPYEDFDFARASVASRVNSSGLVEMVGRTLGSELVTNGDFATDSDWVKGTGWSIANGKASSDGTQSTNSGFIQNSVFDNNKTYKLTFDLISNGEVLKFWVNGTQFINSYSSTDSYVVYINTTTSGSAYFEATADFIGSIDNVSVKEVIDTNNIPRISYDSNGDNGHILLEPTSTNLIPFSEDFNSGWTQYGSPTINTSSIISPDGTLNGSKITRGSNQTPLRYVNVAALNNEYTFSVYAKKGSVDSMFLDIGDVAQVEFTLTDEWQRFKVTQTPTTNKHVDISLGTSVSGDFIYIWGAQLEELPYATSYIPTLTGSTETRATETATGAGSADLINSTEGVLYAEIAALANDQSERQISIDDGSGNNRIILRYNSTSNTINAYLFNGSVQGGEFFHTLTDITIFIKVAFKWKANDFALWVNGVEVGSDNSGTTFSADTLNDISFDFDGLYPFYGKCKALAVFNEALSDSELTQLTT